MAFSNQIFVKQISLGFKDSAFLYCPSRAFSDQFRLGLGVMHTHGAGMALDVLQGTGLQLWEGPTAKGPGYLQKQLLQHKVEQMASYHSPFWTQRITALQRSDAKLLTGFSRSRAAVESWLVTILLSFVLSLFQIGEKAVREHVARASQRHQTLVSGQVRISSMEAAVMV